MLDARGAGKASVISTLDLGMSKSEAQLDDQGVTFDGDQVPWSVIEQIAKEERKVFANEHGRARALQVFSETTGWVRSLCPTTGAPTVLVSGIPMHRIKRTDPMTDTRSKIAALGVQKGRVLDTATGLGYTAIAAARTAREVVTIELDPAAIELCALNPWSQELFTRDNITQMIGDASELIGDMPAGSFSAVLHDPPTIALGGELYSEALYRQLLRVLSRGGRLFHYVGDPDSGYGARITPGVMKRLASAGFVRVQRATEAFGVTAIAA